jgi:hypothetical protein
MNIVDLISEEIQHFLKETPLEIDTDDLHLYFTDPDAVGFLFFDNRIYVGDDHNDIKHRIKKNHRIDNTEFRNRTKFTGRIWMGSKVISFWDYPRDKNEFTTIIKEIEKGTGEKILDNNYRVEVFDKHQQPTIISVEDYTGEVYNPDYIEHTRSPLLKKKRNDPPPYDKYDKLKTEPARWRHYKDKNVAEE